MPATIKTIQGKQLTTFLVTGDPTFSEGVETYKRFYEGKPTKNVLWDFRMGNLSQISSEEFREIVDTVEPFTAKRAGGKTAFLVTGDFEYAISRMIEAFAE